MTRTTITKLILTLLGGIFLFSTTFSKSVHAEENNESTQILKELYLSISEDYKAFWDDVDYYVEIDENNIPSLNIKEFNSLNKFSKFEIVFDNISCLLLLLHFHFLLRKLSFHIYSL